MLRVRPPLGQLISPAVFPAAVAALRPQQSSMPTIAKVGLIAAGVGLLAYAAVRARKAQTRGR